MRDSMRTFLCAATPLDGKQSSGRTDELLKYHRDSTKLLADVLLQVANLRLFLARADVEEFLSVQREKLKQFKRLMASMELVVADIERSAQSLADFSQRFDQCAIAIWSESGEDRPDGDASCL